MSKPCQVPAARKRVAFVARRFAEDALLRNSFYLTMNAGTQAAIGFAFWLLNARLFTPGQIGTATALISGATFISLVSLFGFDSTFVRFLPTSRQRDEEINTGLLIVFATAVVAAALYVVFVPMMVPTLAFIRGSLGLAAGFVVLTGFLSVNLVTDSVFIAFRKAQYNVLCDGIIQGAAKLALPTLLVGLGAYGIFMASGVASVAAVAASIMFMMRTVGYRPKLSVSPGVLRRTWDYSAANYAAHLLTQSPVLIIPLIVFDMRGPRQAAFYFIAYQMASILFSVGWAVSLSLFAEGSHEGSNLPSLLRRAAKIVVLVCVPSSILVAATGHWLLLVFGPAYSVEGASTLVVLALTAPVVALCSIATNVLRITRQLGALVFVSAVYAVLIVGLALLGTRHGLQWVAVAYLLGNTSAGLLAIGLAAVHLRARHGLADARPVPK